MNTRQSIQWQFSEVESPHLERPVPVAAAKDVPYVAGGNRFQTLNIYVPRSLAGRAGVPFPGGSPSSKAPRYLVHVHGGAWRDPFLHASSIEATVAHAFHDFDESSPIDAVVSLDYTLTQFPTHPANPYDATKDRPADRAREAVHPDHVHDVLRGLALLRSLGLSDGSYILSGHSCGACIAFQAALQPPDCYGLVDVPELPRPAALIGLNGLYDLPALVHELGAAHELLAPDYRIMLSNAFGPDESAWSAASPALFDRARIAERVRNGKAPGLVVLEQSADDQLVPMTQRERMGRLLDKVDGLELVVGDRCTGKHAEPWQKGLMIWTTVRDAVALCAGTPA